MPEKHPCTGWRQFEGGSRQSRLIDVLSVCENSQATKTEPCSSQLLANRRGKEHIQSLGAVFPVGKDGGARKKLQGLSRRAKASAERNLFRRVRENRAPGDKQQNFSEKTSIKQYLFSNRSI